MQKTIDETNRRREKQIKYNLEHNITPQAIIKSTENPLYKQHKKSEIAYDLNISTDQINLAADPVVQYMSKEQLEKMIFEVQDKMKKAAAETDYLEAARLRDEMLALGKILKSKEDSVG
jgi:excinuclease ABC subunit B